jgi:hypothetical protein
MMMSRCYNPKANLYHRYGGRGIRVCRAWHDMQRFVDDMPPRPDGCTLDRRDNDGNYSKANCRWATVVEQNINRSCTKWFSYQGRRLTQWQWADYFKVSRGTFSEHVRRDGFEAAVAWATREAPVYVCRGLALTSRQWSERTGVPTGLINKRLAQGRSIEEALTQGRLPRRYWKAP